MKLLVPELSKVLAALIAVAGALLLAHAGRAGFGTGITSDVLGASGAPQVPAPTSTSSFSRLNCPTTKEKRPTTVGIVGD
jgi:hypothetical protein